MLIDLTIRKSCKIKPTPRLLQALGPYDRKPRTEIGHKRVVRWEIPDAWNVLAIVGESMSGKTVLAREVAATLGQVMMLDAKDADGKFVEPFEWPSNTSFIEGFPESASIVDITGALTSVGFASIPDWDKPYRALSAGGQFRVTLARALIEAKLAGKVLIIDEFASLVDPITAKACAAALSKMARREALQVICVGWRRDHLEHLEPDSIWDCDAQAAIVCVDADGRRLVRRPTLELRIFPVDRSAWDRFFAAHHYLDHGLQKQAQCYACCIPTDENGYEPAGFVAVQHFPGTKGKTFREHRLVVIPKFQGLGIGMQLSERLAGVYAATGTPYFSTTAHPGIIAHRKRSPHWHTIRDGTMRTEGHTGLKKADGTHVASGGFRRTSSFRYTGPVDTDGAKRLGLI